MRSKSPEPDKISASSRITRRGIDAAARCGPSDRRISTRMAPPASAGSTLRLSGSEAAQHVGPLNGRSVFAPKIRDHRSDAGLTHLVDNQIANFGERRGDPFLGTQDIEADLNANRFADLAG